MTTTLTLYSFGPSQNAVRPELALLEKGVPFDKVMVDLTKGEHRQPPLAEVTPRGQVPTLVYDNGDGPVVVYESIATLYFIEDMFPQTPLLPPVSEPAARALAHMRIAEFQAKLDVRNIFGSVLFGRKTREQLGERVDSLLAELPRWDGYVDGRPYLAGDGFGLADIAVFPLLMHFEALGYDFAKHTPALAGYLERCKARPSVQESGWLVRFQGFVDAFSAAPVLAD